MLAHRLAEREPLRSCELLGEPAANRDVPGCVLVELELVDGREAGSHREALPLIVAEQGRLPAARFGLTQPRS
jgi:hypothetical protein